MADYYGPKVGTLAGQDASNVAITGGSISGVTFAENFITSSNPATNAAVTTTIVDSYNGVVVTLSAAGNTQTIQNPTTAATIRKFMVINNDTSSNNLSVVAHSVTFTLTPGEGQCFIWDGSAWGPTDLGITDIPVKVTQGGTGLATITDHGIMLGSGTDAVTPLIPLATGEVVIGATGTDPKALAAQIVASRKFLHETGTGTAGQDPTWETLVSGDLAVPLTTPPPIGGVTPAGASFTAVNGLTLTSAAEGFTIAGGAAGTGAPTNFTEMADGGTAIARTTDAYSGSFAGLLTANIADGARFHSNRLYNDSGFVGGQKVNLVLRGKYATAGTQLIGGYTCEIGADTYWYNFNTSTWDIFAGTPTVANYYLTEMDSWGSYSLMQSGNSAVAAPATAINGKVIFMADANASGEHFYIDDLEILVDGTDTALNGGFENWSAANTRTLTVTENLTIGSGFGITLAAEDATGSITLDNTTFEVENTNATQRAVKIVVGTDAAATLQVEGTAGVVNQDVTSDGSPTFTTVNATTFDTNVTAAGVTLSGTTLLADGTDANIDIAITPKGTGSVNLGKVSISSGTITGITNLAVADGGTGASTLTAHGVLLGSGTDPLTPLTPLAAGELLVGVGGADPHALAAGAATKILVGGGAGDPVWTEATGSGAPVRATSPTLVTPALGTPASGDLRNCSAPTEALKGATVYAGTTKALAGTDTASAMTPADVAAVKVDERTHDVINVVEDLSYLPPVTFTWDPGSLADGAGETSAAVPYPGATLGGVSVQAIAPYDLQGITCNAYVDAANSCKVRLQNETGGTIDLASGTWTLQARRV